MKFNKLFLSATLALASTCAFAQAAGEVVEYQFQPHWYGQAQVGLQETLGEASFGKLASFNAQLAGGYNFTPVFGARLALNGWTSKGSMQVWNTRCTWKFNYFQPTVAITADLVNLLGGFNPERKFSAGVLAGIGFNVAWNNDEAQDANRTLSNLAYEAIEQADKRPDALGNLWDGSKVRFVGQFGIYGDYRVSNNVKVGIELQANVLPDGYNSKKAENADWTFNFLAGVKYTFGKSSSSNVYPGYTKTTRPAAVETKTEYVEKIVEVPVEKIVEKIVYKEAPAVLKRNVFFKISTTRITQDQMYNVAEIATFLKDNPKATVTITGYADKGTGSMALNLRLAAKRAQAVVDALTGKFGIAADRIVAKSMGEEEAQPFDSPILNRVSICVAE